eukprot:445789-Amphidinium_carterae.1
MVGGSTPLRIFVVYSITLLHLVFDLLAFRSDLKFWRDRSSFEGISSLSVAMQAVTNLIMVFYLLEQQKAKFLIYIVLARMAFIVWKLCKLTTLQLSATFPFVRWIDRDELSEASSAAMQEIHRDERWWMHVLWMALAPLLAAFCYYRLAFVKQRSWHSWIVSSLAMSVQAGGFIIMTPQVFLNYRLKSVEHLPWKVLVYQAINTFIDDVFMFCIRMPEVQKYSVFRDDIIFVICLIQRWMYTQRRDGEDGTDTKRKSRLELCGLSQTQKAPTWPRTRIETSQVDGPICPTIAHACALLERMYHNSYHDCTLEGWSLVASLGGTPWGSESREQQLVFRKVPPIK